MERCYFGKNIKFIRRHMGYTQKEFAKLFGKSDQSVSNWEKETHTPIVSEVFEMAEIFNVSVNDLLCTDLTTTQYKPFNVKKLMDENKIDKEIADLTEEQQQLLRMTIDFIKKETGKK